MPPEMTPPRDVQDYEAQARELLREIHHGDPLLNMEQAALHLGKIAAALRAEGRAALERAAQLCQDDATYQERGDPRGMALSTAARRIRALIAPAPKSPPATEPKKRTREEWTALADEERRGTEQGMAFLDTVGRDGCMAKPAPAPESPPAPRSDRLATLEAALTQAHEYCLYMFKREWLTDPRNRSIFAAHIFGLIDPALVSRPAKET